MPRFVILYHEMPPEHDRDSHWDVMLEDNNHLLTWAFDKSPMEFQSGEAMQLAPHRLAYLSKEGPISSGRGTVSRIDSGTFEWTSRKQDAITIELAGKRLTGTARLRRERDDAWHWQRSPSDR